MADVLLTHSYHLYYDRKQTRKMQPYLPLGTLYAAALLRSEGVSVAVFDTMLNNPEQGFEEALRRHRPKIVVVYEDSFNYLSKMCLSRMREVAYHILDASLEAGTTVVINGSDATDHTLEYLNRGFHYVLLGEAEWTLLELVSRLNSELGGDARTIAGLAHLHPTSGELIRTERRRLMRDLDMLPLPARDLVPIDQYRDAWKQAHGYFSVNMVSSRGCPYSCNWCARPIYGNSFAVRSATLVAEEMYRLKNESGAEHIWFADDIFGLQSRWVRQFADEVEALDAAVPFKMQTRLDLMTPETTQHLHRAGCVEAWMGVESGSQKILDAMDKGTHIDQIGATRENLRNADIRACYFLQFGYPGETWEDIKETVKMIRTTRPDDIGVSVSYPLPGTKFYDRVQAQLRGKTNWSDSEDLAMMFHGTYTNEFYRALHDALHAEVNSWHGPQSREGQLPSDCDVLWQKVEMLEKNCRNPHATELAEPPVNQLVQLAVPNSFRG